MGSRWQSRRACTHLLLLEHQGTTRCSTTISKEDTGTHPQKTAQRQRQSRRDGRREAIIIKPNPIPFNWATHQLRTADAKLFHCYEFEPHVRLLGLGDPIGTGTPRKSDFKGQWGSDYRISTGQNGAHSWRCTQNKILSAQDPGRSSDPQETEPDLLVTVEGCVVESWVSSG